ncbi:hypothetical protein LRR81_20775 [Metabacillus sp. GX 13764]|uniref:hypothetical protein n=1 Tax=Metabacillus kandeliae TaxID=2900151 RepID=UPI001E451729|nr:hypothetical protein [Metabacillus kandeliae]MCD7036688.1 hypothetical protein [Metabacillus kandeliae]
MKPSDKGIQRGQAITFRVPSDTPDHLLKQLQKLKETERRNFSSKISDFVLKGVGESLSKDRETLTVPLPRQLTKEQRSWLKHEHSEALLGSLIFQLLSNPVRATALLASLNSNAIDIDEALYLQEETSAASEPVMIEQEQPEEPEWTDLDDDDLDDFNLDKIQGELESARAERKEPEESVDDLLGGFLSSMNK